MIERPTMQLNFGEILARYRKKKELTQEAIANKELKLSASHIALLESNAGADRKSPLSREQAWHLVTTLEIFPPDLDDFMESAGQRILRDDSEELFIQRRYPNLEELWIFAKVIRDLDSEWYETVRDNILKGVKYCYFTSNDRICRDLTEKLLDEDEITEKIIEERIECFVLPEEFFLSNFAIYNPGEHNPNMYCCGGIAMYGKAFSFYTCKESETYSFFNTLRYLRRKIMDESPIALPDALYIRFPMNEVDDGDDGPKTKQIKRASFSQKKILY